MKNKKIEEKRILKLVYGEDSEKAAESESPDFILTNSELTFGVEVTEFFYSESNARIFNIPSYIPTILAKKKYRHKDDIKKLKVSEVTLIPHDKKRTRQKFKGIFNEIPSRYKHLSELCNAIKKKDEKFKNNYSKLDHSNLIILDHEEFLINTPHDKIAYLLLNKETRKTLCNTNFKEIFFVTRLGKFTENRQVFIPLKQLLLVDEVHKIIENIRQNHPQYMKKNARETSKLITKKLQQRGLLTTKYDYNLRKDSVEFFFGNSGIRFSKNNTTILDLNDFSTPKNLKMNIKKNTHKDNIFLEELEKLEKNHWLSCPLYTTVKQ